MNTPIKSTSGTKMRTASNHVKSLVLLGFISSIFAAICLSHIAQACGPGRAGGRRIHNRLRKYPPLVQHQYIPNVSENTLGASGRPEGAIKRRDPRFRQLVQNWNPDIEFRDDERTGADRMMTQRLKEKLSVLAISVMNQWPNVRLRVIEGWDEDMRHSANSLHYEGRAVDITTSDKDKSKYGMLARLAVEAGFDWVHYESRSHVHCSVKSEKADTIRNNGCFDAKSLVETPLGQVEMSQLQTNDLVLAMNSRTGQLQFSPVILWLDRDESGSELYVELATKSGQLIRLTSSHLIYALDELPPTMKDSNGDNVGPAEDLIKAAGTGASGNAYPRYYYEYNSNKTPTGSLDEKSSHASDTAEWRPTETSGTNLRPEVDYALQADHLRDLVYTDYARNVLVGQYVLTSVLEEQVELPSATASFEVSSRRQENRINFLSKSRSSKRQRWLQTLESARKPLIKFDQIVSVNFVNRQGIYAPLTREGNIVVNSVVASCYALISDHDMAHLSFAPIRWLNLLQEKTLGLFPTKPLTERLAETLQRRSELQEVYERQSQPNTIHHNTTNGLNRTSSMDEANKATRHVHWYAIILYNIARILLPNSYLY